MKTIDSNPFAPIKALMLDFDGVVQLSEHGDMQHESVQRLNIITEPNDVVVVVTSMQRHGKSRVELQELLTRNGFTGLVIDKTPWLCRPRGLEVKAWLTNTRRNVASFAIIDDGDDFNEFGRDRLVRTSYSGGGLLCEHVDKVRQVLARPWKGLQR